MKPDCLGVIGLGEIGGSLAWQAAQAGVARIVGYSRVRRDAVAAVRAGAVTEIATSARRVAQTVEFLVFATPVSETLRLLRLLGSTLASRSVYCTDLCGVKGPVVEAVRKLGLSQSYAGSSVLLVQGERGFEAARPDRLAGQIVYISPVDGAEHAACEVADFWQRVLDAQPVTVDAERHDRILGWTSHFPRMVAAALAKTLATHGPKGVTYAAATLATTEAAAADAAVWADISLHNRQALLEALESYCSELQWLQSALLEGDRQGVRHWIESGSAWRRATTP